MANKVKRLARDLQRRTGWAYTECLRCIRERLSDAEIEALIAKRGPAP